MKIKITKEQFINIKKYITESISKNKLKYSDEVMLKLSNFLLSFYDSIKLNGLIEIDFLSKKIILECVKDDDNTFIFNVIEDNSGFIKNVKVLKINLNPGNGNNDIDEYKMNRNIISTYDNAATFNLIFDGFTKNNAKRKVFITNIKNIKSINQNDSETDDVGTGDNNNDKINKTNKPEDEEENLKKGKIALNMIMKDDNLKNAFYKNPTFFKLFISELKGGEATGKGLLMALEIVDSYNFKKLNKELDATFIPGKDVLFTPFSEPYTIKYLNKVFTLKMNEIKKATVMPYQIGNQFIMLENKREDFKIYIKSKTNEENVYKCELIKYVSTTEKGIEEYKYDDFVYLKFNIESEGYKPLEKI